MNLYGLDTKEKKKKKKNLNRIVRINVEKLSDTKIVCVEEKDEYVCSQTIVFRICLSKFSLTHSNCRMTSKTKHGRCPVTRTRKKFILKKYQEEYIFWLSKHFLRNHIS